MLCQALPAWSGCDAEMVFFFGGEGAGDLPAQVSVGKILKMTLEAQPFTNDFESEHAP